MHYTKSAIKALLTDPDTRGKATRKGILYLFSCQLHDEKMINDAKYRNNQGFSAATAHAGSVIAKKFIQRDTLTPKEWRKANDICITHAKQLTHRANMKAIMKASSQTRSQTRSSTPYRQLIG